MPKERHPEDKKQDAMLSIKIDRDLQAEMDKFRREHHLNWSGYVKDCIRKKIKEKSLS